MSEGCEVKALKTAFQKQREHLGQRKGVRLLGHAVAALEVYENGFIA